MTEVESAWDRYPGYRVALLPFNGTGRISHGGRILAESEHCLIVAESDHGARLYFPEAAVNWDLFEPTDHSTTCPFKGAAQYWSLSDTDAPLENVLWGYPIPFPQVADLAGHVAFYEDRVEATLVEAFPDDPEHEVSHSFPPWGDAADLLNLIDVEPNGAGRFVSPPFPDPPLGEFFPGLLKENPRLVIEGGQLLAEGIVAAAKTVPGQRVTSASMIFCKAAMFDSSHDVEVEVLRPGRTFSTVQIHVTQDEKLRSAGVMLLDSGASDTIRGSVAPPDVPGPYECPQLDMAVTGRELRTVDNAYRRRPEETGPQEIYTWARFRHAPDHDYLHAALLAQSTTHWTIAASMRPHEGITEAQAHVTLSTGIMATTIAFHDEFDVSDWLLYTNPAIYAGRGLAQGEGRVFSQAGDIVASYTVQAMVRAFNVDPDAMGKDYADAM
jgi:acyl-CoA thioesterase-2